MFSSKRSRRRLSKLRRSPKIFVPVSSERQVVIPFRPVGAVLVIFFFATTVYFLLRSDIFQIKELEFEFEEIANEALVRQRISEEVLGRSTVFLDADSVEEEIKGEFLTVKAIELEKKLPDGLRIKVSVRVPLAQIRVGESEVLLVDGEGVLFRKASDEDLPMISLGSSFSAALGEIVGSDEVKAYLEVLSAVDEEGLTAASITLNPDLIDLRLELGTVVRFSVEKSVAGQVEILVALLKRFGAAGRTPTEVDLRFDRPVARF